MKTVCLTAALLVTALSPGFAQGTVFTYQGRLNDGTNAAHGSYDLTFALFNTNSGGAQIAGPTTNSAIFVTNGLFLATLDFGNAFDGTARWLEIGVRTNGGANFITLAPRQALPPAPYALFANTANSVSGTIPANQVSGTVLSAAVAGDATALNGQSGSYYLNLANQTGTLSTSQLPPAAINSRGVLAADFELDEVFGATFADSSGFGNDATAPVGGLGVGSAGHSGKAVSFAGGFLKVPSGIPDSPQVWVEAWVKPNSSSTAMHTVLFKTGAYSLQVTNGATGVGSAIFSVTTANGTSSLISSAAINNASWSHIAGWYNGFNLALEVNGTTTTTPFGGGAIVSTASSPLYIGAADDAATQSFSGLIDEVRIRTVAPPTSSIWPQINYNSYSASVSFFNITNYSPYAVARSGFNFNKLLSNTRLRVTYNDSIQVTGQGATLVAATWEVLVDGQPVFPAPLKFTYYDPQDTGVTLPLNLIGWETGAAAGAHNVEVTVKAATTGAMNAFTGSQSGAGLLQVEEIP